MDFAILYGIQDLLGCPFLDALMPVVTACGDHGLIWIIAGILLLIFPKTRRWGVTLLVTLAITWAICEFGVKNLVARPRPFIVDSSYMLLIAAPASFSFPSGHALSSFLAATVITRAPSPWLEDCHLGHGRCHRVLASLPLRALPHRRACRRDHRYSRGSTRRLCQQPHRLEQESACQAH